MKTYVDLSEANVFGTSHYVRPLYLYSSDLSEVNVFGTSKNKNILYYVKILTSKKRKSCIYKNIQD